MTKFADITLNQMKIISKAAGNLLSFETLNTITLYHVQQSPVIFRSVLKKDIQDKFRLFLMHLPSSIPLKAPLKEEMTTKVIEEIAQGTQQARDATNDARELFPNQGRPFSETESY